MTNMARPRVLILRAPGTNCDRETAFAFELCGGEPHRLHINRLLEFPRLCAEFQILCIPGGFSYGDDLAAGRILGSQIRAHLAETLGEFKAAGKLILGICNGFQVLAKSGILLDDEPCAETGIVRPPATLTLNDSGKYEDRWVRCGRSAASACSLPASKPCICRSPMPRENSCRAMNKFSRGCEPVSRSRWSTRNSMRPAMPPADTPTIRTGPWPTLPPCATRRDEFAA